MHKSLTTEGTKEVIALHEDSLCISVINSVSAVVKKIRCYTHLFCLLDHSNCTVKPFTFLNIQGQISPISPL